MGHSAGGRGTTAISRRLYTPAGDFTGLLEPEARIPVSDSQPAHVGQATDPGMNIFKSQQLSDTLIE